MADFPNMADFPTNSIADAEMQAAYEDAQMAAAVDAQMIEDDKHLADLERTGQWTAPEVLRTPVSD